LLDSDRRKSYLRQIEAVLACEKRQRRISVLRRTEKMFVSTDS